MELHMNHTNESLCVNIKSEKKDINDDSSNNRLNLNISVDVEECKPWQENITNYESNIDWSVDNTENQNESNKNLLVDTSEIKSDATLHECKICKKFYKYKMWHEHITSVHSTLTFLCDHDQCDKTFGSKKYLRQHKARVHMKQNHSKEIANNQFPCPECDNVFTHKPNLAVHKKTVHCGKDQMATCGLCNSQLKNRNYLNAHMLRVHYDDGKNHPCDVCGKSYKSPRYLRIHKKNVHVEINGKYYLKSKLRMCQCGCKKHFLTEEDLQKHIVSNNLDKTETINIQNCQDIYLNVCP